MRYHSALKQNEKKTCYNTDGPWKHYAKSEKSDTKDFMLCDSIYMKSPEEANPYRQNR